MKIEQLVNMANDIAAFFTSEPEHELAVDGVYNHIKRFWDPRMRKEIISYHQSGGEGLNALLQEALVKLAADQPR